jgi:hypothetical protein
MGLGTVPLDLNSVPLYYALDAARYFAPRNHTMKAFFQFLFAVFAGTAIGAGGWYTYHDYYPQMQAAAFDQSLQSDIVGRVVPVRDPENPGAVVGWYFSKGEMLTVKKVDVRRDDARRYILYADIWSIVDDGKLELSGLCEAHYHKINDKFYLVGLGDVDLKMRKYESEKKDNGAKPKRPPQPTDTPKFVPAQKMPGSK